MAKKKVKKSAPVKKSAVKKVAKIPKIAKAAKKVKKVSKPAPKKSVKPATKNKISARPVVTSKMSIPSKKSEVNFQSFLKPLDDRIVVLVGEKEKMTEGGLYIPDTVTDVSGNYQGKVVAVGRGHMNKKGKVKPLDVSVGDKVMFSQFSGSQLDMDGRNIMIIRESDVLGIVK